MNSLQRWYYTAQALGWENLPRRVWQVAKGRLGISKARLPGGELSPAELRSHFIPGYLPDSATARWAERARRLGWDRAGLERVRAQIGALVDDARWRSAVLKPVAALARGEMVQFNHRVGQTGWPPDFNRDPLHGVAWPHPRHWSTYAQFHPELRDMKCVWEPSRFSWAFLLARAHVRDGASWPVAGGAPAPAEMFWAAFDAWDSQNPYGLTPQWACGQEATFRMFAWLLTACATLDHPAAAPARLARLTERVWYTGRHIEGNINYARSQKNNHAISEAIGLWTIGSLFPEIQRAAVWRTMGKRVLEQELRRQIFDDGSYVQHSLNYQRVMLDDVLWAMHLGRVCDDPIALDALDRVARALDWLLEMTEPTGGGVPNYGNNDGAWVLPLSTVDYTDFRPIGQALHRALRGAPAFEAGPWDELSAWLVDAGGPNIPRERATARDAQSGGPSVVRRECDRAFPAGGYYVLSGPSSWGMVRCHTYRARPGQADMLHFDLWHGATNVLRDAGSFFYYTDEPWHSHFFSTAAHNTVEVDGADQMIKGPRFLWLRWTKARLLRFDRSPDGRAAVFSGEHYGYTRLPGDVVHRRTILRLGDSYVIIDDLLGSGEHEVALRWRLCEARWAEQPDGWIAADVAGGPRMQLAGTAALRAELLRGQESPRPEGWESLYYADRQAVPVVRLSGRASLPLRLATCVAPLCGPVLANQPAISPAEPVVLTALPAELHEPLRTLRVPLLVKPEDSG